MDFEMNLKKYADFVRSEKREMIPRHVSPTEIEVLALSNALGGEVGELQNVVKKILAQDQFFVPSPLNDKFVEEVGDVLWYVFRLVQKYGYTVEQIMNANITKLTERYKEVSHGEIKSK